MKRNLLVLGIALLSLVFAIACGDDGGGNELGAEESAKVYTAVSTAVGEAMGEVMSGLGSLSGRIKEGEESNWTFNEDGSFSGTIAGAKGGTATVSGTGSFTEDSYDYSFTITFVDYVTTEITTSEDITLNGEVTYEFEGSSTSYTAVYKGEVTASGAVEGTASFDLTITMSGGRIEISGHVGGQKFEGGYDY